jgi:hypothetical protein
MQTSHRSVSHDLSMTLLHFATPPGLRAPAESKVCLQVLLINFPSLGNNEAGETIRFIFREAKIHDAVRGA